MTLFGISFLAGNALAIAARSVVNFLVADRLVFTTGAPATSTR